MKLTKLIAAVLIAALPAAALAQQKLKFAHVYETSEPYHTWALWAAGESELLELEDRARRNGIVCYTAYNHRFEPHYVRMRDLIASGELGTQHSACHRPACAAPD